MATPASLNKKAAFFRIPSSLPTTLFAIILFPITSKTSTKDFRGSKFILTVRDLDSWLASVKGQTLRNRWNPFYKGTYNDFDEAQLKKRWSSHREEIMPVFEPPFAQRSFPS